MKDNLVYYLDNLEYRGSSEGHYLTVRPRRVSQNPDTFSSAGRLPLVTMGKK